MLKAKKMDGALDNLFPMPDFQGMSVLGEKEYQLINFEPQL